MPKKLAAIPPSKSNVSNISNPKSSPTDAHVGGSDLQQIQNLLFGEQSRAIDANLQELDKRLNERLDNITQSFDEQFQRLHKMIAEQGKKESAERSSANASLVAEMSSVRSSLCDAVADLIDKQEADKKAFNQRVDTSSKKLAAQFEQKNEQVIVQFQKQQQSLDKNKVSKDALSKILIDLSSAV